MKKRFIYILLACGFMIQYGNYSYGGSFTDRFIDPTDGKFDVSDWLLESKGFLPVPILVTEPAVGYGGGAALLFFHTSMSEQISKMQVDDDPSDHAGKQKRLLPPSISGAYGLYTENDTWAAGGFHFASWKNDHIRFIINLTKASINIKYYGSSEDGIFSNGLEYNLDGWLFYNQDLFRVANSDVFAGVRLIHFDARNRFDLGGNIAGIETWELDFKNTGLGFIFQYDSRDNIFTPNKGIYSDASVMFFQSRGVAGINREYQITNLKTRMYWGIMHNMILGWRIEGNLSSGSVPFYALPFINLRGVPFNRYQNNHALQTEIEARYQIADRWGLVPFMGVGATADQISNFGDNSPKWAGGLGFRYLMARKLRLFSGIDIARGAEDWTFYIQMGSGL